MPWGIERHYDLVWLPADGVRFSDAVRQHWGVENGLHGVLDVSFDEDACRIRQDKGAQTFSMLRHIALNPLKRESQHKRGIKARRKRAGWDRDYLLQVLTASSKCACPENNLELLYEFSGFAIVPC
jgi:hypothetical protein